MLFAQAVPWSTTLPDEPPGDLRVELGRAIRGLRRYHGLTQRELGERCGLDQSTISRLENGRVVSVRLSRVLDVLEVMGVERIGFRSRYEGATIAAFMARKADAYHSDVSRPNPVDEHARMSDASYAADGHMDGD